MKMICTAVLSLALVAPALAQNEHAGHGAAPATGEQVQLPEVCRTAATPMPDMPMSAAHEMDEAHAALMSGMDEMNKQMMTGMMAEDIDVAFVCGMIPHHQSAINMARAELEHGDNDWAKQMAQKVIDAQQQEIAEMVDWLEQQPR